MRIAWVAVLLALTACSATANRPGPASPLASDPITPCADPRPELCTMEYAPACGSLIAGGFRTYSSGCNACADEGVKGYQSGPCSE